MKMTFKKFALLGLAFMAMFVLVGCTDTTTTGEQTTTTLSETQKVQAVLDGISLGDITAVTENLTLPTASVNGVSLTWSTANADVVTSLGEITTPDFVTGDQTVVLTLTAVLNQTTLTKTFNVTVKAEAATDFLNRVGVAVTITNSDSIVSDFKLPGTAQGVTMTWTSSNAAVATVSSTVGTDGFYTVTVTRPIIEDDGVDTSVVLTGVLTIGTNSVTITKNIRVLAMNEINLLTIAEASAKPDGEIVTFSGIVTALVGNSAFVQDTTGGIYIYAVSSTLATNVVIGNEISVTGEIDIYNSFVEVKNITAVELISSDNDLPAAEDFTLVDLEALFAIQGQRANVTQLKLAEEVTTSITSSVVFTVTDGLTEVEVKIDKYVEDTIQAQINAIIDGLVEGDTFKFVNVPIAAYYGDGQFYLTDPSQIVILTDAEKFAADKATLSIPTSSFSEGTITVPVAGIGGSAIAWEVSPTTATINPTTGVVVFPNVSVNTVFTFTATLTKGTFTAETKTFDVTAIALSATEKVAADMADIEVALTAKELDKVTLPVLGAKGSTISWAVEGNAIFTTPELLFDFNESVAYTVTLTATVTNTAVTDTKEFVIEVAPLTIVDIEDVYTAEIAEGAIIAIRGILTGQTTNNHFWVQDATGGLNVTAFNVSGTLKDEVVGSEIIFIGEKDIYNGLYEIIPTKYFVLNSTPALPTPTDISEVAFNTTDLLAYQGQLVSFTGFTVKVLPAADSNGTYQFTIEDVATERVIVVRLDYRVPNYLAAKDQILTLTLGQEVDVVGAIMNWFNTYQLSIFNDTQVIDHVATPQEIAAADVAALTIPATYDSGEVYALPGTSNTSTIVWTVAANGTIDNNTITFATVTETTVVTLTATFTYGTGETPVVTVETYDVSIVVLTAAEKLAADAAELVDLAKDEISTVDLATAGTFGSTISWALAVGELDATIEGAVLTLPYKGEAYTVSLVATLALTGTDPITKEITITVSPLAVVSDISTLNTKTAGEWNVANGTILYLKGVVTQLYYTSGFFMQDANGNGIYVKGSTTYAVGDEVIISATTGQVTSDFTTKLVRYISSYTPFHKLPAQKEVVPTVLTLEQLSGITETYYQYAGMLVNVTGITIKEFSGNYMILNWATIDNEGTPVVYTLRSPSINNATYSWLAVAYEAGDALPSFDFVFYTMYSDTTFTIVFKEGLELTDQIAVDLNKDLLPASLELTSDYVLPTPIQGATMAITARSVNLESYISLTGVVTLPDVDVTGTITVTITKGEVTNTVDIPLTVKALSDAEKLALAVADMPSTLNLAQDFILEPLLFSAIYGEVVVASELSANLSHVLGELIVTRPTAGSAAVVGTVTINVGLGIETAQKVVTVTVLPFASDLFISEYIEGSSNNKSLEIYNDTGVSVDLSTYVLELYSNGSLTATTTETLTGTLAHGDVFVYSHASAIQAILDVTDLAKPYPSVATFTGNDAIVLKNSGTVIDSYGKIGEDLVWASEGVTGGEKTLVRINTINSGDTVTDDAYLPNLQWVAYPQNTTTYLGYHVVGDVSSVQE